MNDHVVFPKGEYRELKARLAIIESQIAAYDNETSALAGKIDGMKQRMANAQKSIGDRINELSVRKEEITTEMKDVIDKLDSLALIK